MNLKLDGKSAFISGSTAGIGYAITKSLSEEAVDVIINGRSEESVSEAVEKLKETARER